MDEQFGDFLTNLSEFLLFFVVAAVLTVVFVLVFVIEENQGEFEVRVAFE